MSPKNYLLQKENDFYKENEQIEQKTKELLSKVHDVMKIQENLSVETYLAKQDVLEAQKLAISEPKTCISGLKFTEQELQEFNFPESVNEMGLKARNHLMKSKLKSLQLEFGRLEVELKKKNEELKKQQKDNQHLLQDKDKWFQSHSQAKSLTSKLENQNSLLLSKSQAKESECLSLRKEIEQLKKELKNLSSTFNNNELKLNRLHEENEKLKATLKTLKDEDRESKEGFRKQISELNTTVKTIEKHKTELLNGFKKQLCLIDNLKKQKIHLESLKAAEYCEADFIKILDLKL